MRRLLALVTLMATPVAAAGSYDGVYAGTRTTKQLATTVIGCQPANAVPVRFKVENNHFNFKIGVDTNVIEIGPDGTFNQSFPFRYNAGYTMNTVVKVSGRIVGNDFQIESGNQFCASHYVLKRS